MQRRIEDQRDLSGSRQVLIATASSAALLACVLVAALRICTPP